MRHRSSARSSSWKKRATLPAPRSNGALRLTMRDESCSGFILQLQTDGVLANLSNPESLSLLLAMCLPQVKTFLHSTSGALYKAVVAKSDGRDHNGSSYYEKRCKTKSLLGLKTKKTNTDRNGASNSALALSQQESPIKPPAAIM